MMTFMKGASNPETLGQLWQIGVNHLKWMGGSFLQRT
jgi:hypothetical protein